MLEVVITKLIWQKTKNCKRIKSHLKAITSEIEATMLGQTKMDYSPEQISGYYNDKNIKMLSLETIYQYI